MCQNHIKATIINSKIQNLKIDNFWKRQTNHTPVPNRGDTGDRVDRNFEG